MELFYGVPVNRAPEVTYWQAANSPLVWVLVAVSLAFVALLAVYYLVKSWKRALSLGLQKETLKKVVKSTISFVIVPSLSMLIGFLTLAAVLGMPLSWFRLSVVGSTTYELMAADMVSTGMGYENLAQARDADASVFVAVMLVMAIGILGGIITNIFAAKKITTSMTTYTQKNAAWGAVFASCFMLTLIAVFVPGQFAKGPVAILTIATSMLVTLLLSFLAKRFKLAWMSEFTLAFALIIGMVSSVFWTRLLG